MRDLSIEACFSQKMFSNEVNMGVPSRASVKKTFYEVETHWLSGKEKIVDAASSKEGLAYSVLGHEKTHPNWFPLKGATVNSTTYYQLLRQNSPYLLNDPHIYTNVCVCVCVLGAKRMKNESLYCLNFDEDICIVIVKWWYLDI